jgi:hypothetical protein
VKGVRFGKGGRRIRTLPTLLIPFRGEVSIDLRASSEVKRQRLVTTFASVPDANIGKLELELKGGKGGILTVTNRSLCSGKQVMGLELDGQNGKAFDRRIRMSTPCPKPSPRKGKGRK